jgi:hypothetical protein
MMAAIGAGPRVGIEAIVSPDLDGPPLVGWSDLCALGVSVQYPKSARVRAAGRQGRGHVNHVAVNQVDAEQQFLGEGTDTLDRVKLDFVDVLCSSLGDAAGCIKGKKMAVEIDEDKRRSVQPLMVTTARQVPVHMQKMADVLMRELGDSKAVERYDMPTEWCSPGHFVLKACGKTVSLVADYRHLN